jgi:polyisoprenoid-binding protein YceI
MSKAIFILTGLILMVVLFACKAETTGDISPQTIQNYQYNEGKTKLEWTAYKTNSKVPVTGGFNEIIVASESSNDPKEVIESLTFTINTASVETNNEDRNGKIVKHFFETINSPTIEGRIKSLDDDNSATIEVTMNGITFDVVGTYTLEGPIFTFESIVDVSSWNGVPGITALNEVCNELHIEKDGSSKLWTEVKLSLSTKLKTVS